MNSYRSKRITTPNGQLHYWEYGSIEKPTLFLIHGIPGSSACWESLAVLLSNDYRVIVPDLLGFGKSDTPTHDFYINGQAQALATLFESVEAVAPVVFAHDFGVPVIVTMMRSYPGITISKLILASTNLFTDTYIPPPLRLAKVPLVGTLVFWLLAGNKFGLRLMYSQAVRRKDRYSYSQFKKSISRQSMHFTRKIFQKSLANLRVHYHAIEEYLPNIKIPVLVMWTDKDPFFSLQVGIRTSLAFEKGKLKVFSNTGHFIPSELPEAVAFELRSFLNK